MKEQWRVREIASVWYGPAVEDADGKGVALVCGAGSNLERAAANARLISMAPDMREALRAAADALDYAQAQVDSDNDRQNILRALDKVQSVLGCIGAMN